MNIIHPPHTVERLENGPLVFLAGSIEMGKAVDWQKEMASQLEKYPMTLLNPRRPDWDSSWEQSASNPNFRTQVEWELSAQEQADIIVMYFDPSTQSPITLLELGLFAATGKLIVCCPEGYWRKGNIDIVCERYGVEQVNTLSELIECVKQACS